MISNHCGDFVLERIIPGSTKGKFEIEHHIWGEFHVERIRKVW